ncbi:MAG: DUF362 domain-containing protein [Gemmatimonadota bacterium]|nr:DUF362 domain-containing protein [Gemmatimonadota bacterium]
MKPWLKAAFFVTLPALVAADLFVWSQAPVEHTRWRMLEDFECISPLKTSTVSIVPSDYSSLDRPCPITDSLDYGQVEAMVEKAIELAGGIESLLDGSERKFVLKPNLVEPAPNGNGVDTDWRVVKALVLHLYRMNPEFEIRVAEGAGGWATPGTPNVRSWALKDGYTITGYKAMIESLQSDPEYPDLDLEWVDLNYDDTVEVQVPEPRLSDCQTSFFLPKTIAEADFLINVPVLKVHSTRITVGLKNYVGVLPGMVYGWSKDAGYNGNGIGLDHTTGVLEENFVDIARTAPCDFVVVDGIVGKELSKYASGKAKRRNMIVAGRDVVSVDAVCAALMDINPDDVEHICVAALAGMGQNDLGRIDVTGSTIEQSATKFIKAKSHLEKSLINQDHPYYGQSNRVWIFKGPYRDLDMDTDSVGGEAVAAPVPGRDGWSEPVFFFDNLIDPAALHQETSDNAVHYAFTYLVSPQASRAGLWLGSRQDLKVFLNGRVVYDHSGTRTHLLPNEVVEIDLEAGVNRILVKAGQSYGRSEFSLNVCEIEQNTSYDGNRLAGAKFLTDARSGGASVIAGEISCQGSREQGVPVALKSLLINREDTTCADGRFSFSGLPAGTYLITPSHGDYLFEPPRAEVVLSEPDSADLAFEAIRSRGDYNGDGKVSIFDLIALLQGLSQGDQGEQDEKYDFNGDGAINVFDLLDLLGFLKDHR